MCVNAQANLFTESGFDNNGIKWFRNDTLLTFTNDSIKTNIPGLYEVRMDSLNCHTRSNTLRITIQPQADVRIKYTKDSAVCEGTSIGLEQADKRLTTRWFRNNTFISSGNTFSTVTAGKIYAIGADGFGCNDTSNTLQAVVYPKPVPVITRRSDSLFCNITADSFQWFYNNVPVSKATQKFLKLQLSGNYYVEAYSNKRCKGTSTVYKYTNVSVQQLSAQSFNIYPNPAHTTLTIGLDGIRSVKVIDATGKVCLEAGENVVQLDISELAEGIYTLLVETSSSIRTGTFIKVK